MYFVIVGIMSARAPARCQSRASATAPPTRRAPNNVAKTSGSSPIANTFRRTGQLRGDQSRGRAAGRSRTVSGSAGTASARWARRVNAGRAGRLNMLMSS